MPDTCYVPIFKGKIRTQRTVGKGGRVIMRTRTIMRSIEGMRQCEIAASISNLQVNYGVHDYKYSTATKQQGVQRNYDCMHFCLPNTWPWLKTSSLKQISVHVFKLLCYLQLAFGQLDSLVVSL